MTNKIETEEKALLKATKIIMEKTGLEKTQEYIDICKHIPKKEKE